MKANTSRAVRLLKRRSRKVISYTMSRIRAQDTSIEIALRRALWRAGLRYRKNFGKVLGKPDVVFVGKKVAVFCDSSFWHGRNARKSIGKIRSNKEYWRKKILGNVARDKLVNRSLHRDGWQVLRFWDNEIQEELTRCVAQVLKAVAKANPKANSKGK